MKPIKDFPNYFITEQGQVVSTKTSKPVVLKSCTDNFSRGYYYVTLYKDTLKYQKRINRLVADAFIPNPNNYPCVCHKDDNPGNNNVDNLFWGTNQDNSTDMVKKNRQAKGSKHGMALLTEQDVTFIKNHPIYRGYQVSLAKQFSISVYTIQAIKAGKTWKHI